MPPHQRLRLVQRLIRECGAKSQWFTEDQSLKQLADPVMKLYLRPAAAAADNTTAGMGVYNIIDANPNPVTNVLMLASAYSCVGLILLLAPMAQVVVMVRPPPHAHTQARTRTHTCTHTSAYSYVHMLMLCVYRAGLHCGGTWVYHVRIQADNDAAGGAEFEMESAHSQTYLLVLQLKRLRFTGHPLFAEEQELVSELRSLCKASHDRASIDKAAFLVARIEALKTAKAADEYILSDPHNLPGVAGELEESLEARTRTNPQPCAIVFVVHPQLYTPSCVPPFARSCACVCVCI